MPVILSQSNEAGWTRASNHLSDVLRLLNPYPAEKMNAYPVSELVNVEDLNERSLLNPVGDKLQIESNPVRVEGGYRVHKAKGSSDKPWFEGK